MKVALALEGLKAISCSIAETAPFTYQAGMFHARLISFNVRHEHNH